MWNRLLGYRMQRNVPALCPAGPASPDIPSHQVSLRNSYKTLVSEGQEAGLDTLSTDLCQGHTGQGCRAHASVFLPLKFTILAIINRVH